MTNRDRPLNVPYTQVPHGLWTLNLTPKAILLLGWLHSHADDYLSRLSVSRIGREFGGGRKSVSRLLGVLSDAGYVKIPPGRLGTATTVMLLSGPSEDLTRV